MSIFVQLPISFEQSLPVVTVLSAILFFYSTGFYDYWLLTWLAPLPICLYALKTSAQKAALASFLAYVFGAMNQLGYLPLPLFAGTTTLNAAAFAAAVLLFRAMVQSNHHNTAAFTFASGWTSYEFIRSFISSFGTFESLAYTQVLNLPVIQIAYLTGIWGITFLLMLLPASLAILWHYRQNWCTCQLTTFLTGGLLITVIFFGSLRLHFPANNHIINVGLVAIPTTRELLHNQDAQTITASLHHYRQGIEKLANAGAQIVLLPEKLAVLTPDTRQACLTILSEAASKNKVTLIAGFSNQEKQLYNTALVFAPNDSLVQNYHKQHLLPAYESIYTPGEDLTLLDINMPNSGGIAICKDMDFVQPAREYSRRETGILFVPALDFHDDGWLHARVAIMRGVEGNYAVARAAQWGLLTVSDNLGHLVGITDTNTAASEASLLCKISLGNGQSFYSQTGDWLAWICLLLTTHAVIQLHRQKK
ncbi:Apolipoprotein N-acyltransferase [Sporomusa ovata DSM 2662]|uniref:Apolipoprotein N-acyltransferase / Copper homeostasis protein CutE n=1 Tax=Sporomusa ovata TaxID=2378 RepID=A0A0U1L2W2_9FIRM|nr:nitrilase-related carbon-nitrogen hydrolase [Sporomusa ovata]EQB25292.1 nitrilase/cyanide hydratase and apolipoprotein N-acyltransferase [Sporomusa ovata DSM 2662]CQR73855.1 Apolipoprotein N-acyltransferase / Copper homeostasis protein CutE [Sporomusa ovata]